MCFSAPVSFAASGIVGAIGIATLKEVKNKRDIPFASVPFIFALHQLMEGLIWTAYDGGTPILLTNYLYLFIAIAFWPLYFPIGVYFLEEKKNKTRLKILRVLIVIGALVSLVSTWSMFLAPISVTVVCNSLFYGMGLPIFPWYAVRLLQMFYVISGVGCMFVSSHRFMKFFGIGMMVSFLITYIFHYQVYFSVWCFFSALLSISIYYFFKTRQT